MTTAPPCWNQRFKAATTGDFRNHPTTAAWCRVACHNSDFSCKTSGCYTLLCSAFCVNQQNILSSAFSRFSGCFVLFNLEFLVPVLPEIFFRISGIWPKSFGNFVHFLAKFRAFSGSFLPEFQKFCPCLLFLLHFYVTIFQKSKKESQIFLENFF